MGHFKLKRDLEIIIIHVHIYTQEHTLTAILTIFDNTLSMLGNILILLDNILIETNILILLDKL